jgi:hypothetical protein
MKFELLPVIDKMLALYSKPASMERFREYLHLLEGGKKDNLAVPVMNYNPMAKEHAAQKLEELKKLQAEKISSETMIKINSLLSKNDGGTFQVALNLADDLKGGWTNRYTTDYDSKFKLHALVKRNFCTPLFWTSESYSAELIQQRTAEACLRTHYFFTHSDPVTLEDHIAQEKFVSENLPIEKTETNYDKTFLQQFYNEHKASDNFVLIFNFLYGDDAAEKLGYSGLGIKDAMAGFRFAKSVHL